MDFLKKINFNDIRGKEILFWSILVLNLFGFFLNIFTGDWFFLMNIIGAGLMVYVINNYYHLER